MTDLHSESDSHSASLEPACSFYAFYKQCSSGTDCFPGRLEKHVRVLSFLPLQLISRIIAEDEIVPFSCLAWICFELCYSWLVHIFLYLTLLPRPGFSENGCILRAHFPLHFFSKLLCGSCHGSQRQYHWPIPDHISVIPVWSPFSGRVGTLSFSVQL